MAEKAAEQTSRKKDEAYLQVGTNRFAEIKVRKSSFSTPLATALGYDFTLPANGEIVATGRSSAIERGCFPIILEYQVAAGRTQTARVLCSPAKADTVADDAKGKQYRGNPVVKVRAPRRRVFIV